MIELEFKDAGRHIEVLDNREKRKRYWVPKSKLVMPTGLVKTQTVLGTGKTTKVPPGVNAPIRSAVQQVTPRMPGIGRRVKNFAKAAKSHVKAKRKKASLEVIQNRWAKCNLCPSLVRINQQSGKCSEKKCGCVIANDERLKNKLAWAEQECPLEKWGPVDG